MIREGSVIMKSRGMSVRVVVLGPMSRASSSSGSFSGSV